MEKKKSKNIAGKILESTVIGSAAKNENWTVNQKQNVFIKYIVMEPNAVHPRAKGTKINLELSRGGCGKRNQPTCCCHGFSQRVGMNQNMPCIQYGDNSTYTMEDHTQFWWL